MSDTERAALRLVTFDPAPAQPAELHACAGYTCDHPACAEERARLVARGVRGKRRPVPAKRAA